MPFHFECPECEFDDKEAGWLAERSPLFCPLCLIDTGHFVPLRMWPADDAARDLPYLGENL